MATSRCRPYCRGHGCGRPGAHTPAAGAAVPAAVPGLAQPEPGAGRGGRRPGDGAGGGAGVDPDGIRRPHPLRRRRRRRLPRRLPPAPRRAGRAGAPTGRAASWAWPSCPCGCSSPSPTGTGPCPTGPSASPFSCWAWPWRCGHPAPPTRVSPHPSRTLPWPTFGRRRPRRALPPRPRPSAGATLGLALLVAAVGTLIAQGSAEGIKISFGLAALVCGLGLLVGTFAGRARWLVVPAALLAGVSVAGAAIEDLDVSLRGSRQSTTYVTAGEDPDPPPADVDVAGGDIHLQLEDVQDSPSTGGSGWGTGRCRSPPLRTCGSR